MSTRCQVIVKDNYSEVWFYRHSDGYPEGTLPSLEKFLNWVKEGRIRDNSEQSAGWLVIIGHEEYNVPNEPEPTMRGWKVGAFEPCAPMLHFDVDFLYTVDLKEKRITYLTGDKLERLAEEENENEQRGNGTNLA